MNVKPGDEVILYPHYGEPNITTVKRVTPSGIIHIQYGSGEKAFNKDGYERGSAGWGKDHIVAATQENRADFEEKLALVGAQRVRNGNIHKIRGAVLTSLTDDQLARIVAIIDEPRAGSEAQ